MSLLSRLFARMLKHNAHDEVVDHLTFVTCPDCGHHTYGFTEYEAAMALSKHAILTHTEPPAEDVPEFEDAPRFRSELRERIYGDQ